MENHQGKLEIICFLYIYRLLYHDAPRKKSCFLSSRSDKGTCRKRFYAPTFARIHQNEHCGYPPNHTVVGYIRALGRHPYTGKKVSSEKCIRRYQFHAGNVSELYNVLDSSI